MKLLMVLMTLVLGNAYACPELNGVDLADGDGPWTYTELEISGLVLSEAEFNNIPTFAGDFDYEQCKDAIVASKVQDKLTGKIFTAVYTNEDHCDGGNSYGVLYDQEMQTILGTIGDSFISCY